MEWYSGDVTAALNSYQEKKGILIVYVYSDDDNSTKFDKIWDSFDPLILNPVPYVAIRLAKDTEGANQFAQFFPTPVFPVCYILGLNAQPLEVLTAVEEMTVERLNSSMVKAISLYDDQKKEQGLSTGGVVSAGTEKTTSITEDTQAANATKPPDEPSNDEKLEYYRKRLEEKHKGDLKKKEQEERGKEILRRNEGKALAEVREKQRERELKEMAEQRRKQKEEDAQALKRIREQLRQDKEERTKRTGGSQQATDSVSKAPEVEEPIKTAPVNSAQCRIQCKFPDGSTLTEVFESNSPLQVVHDAVSHDARAPPNFFLVQPYPRRKLTEFGKTLLELDLTPSSAILVLAQTKVQQSVLPSTGYLSMVFGLLQIPLSFLGVICRFFTSLFAGRRTDTIPNQHGPTPTQNSSGREKKNERTKGGNIARFRNDESDHSDNEATWNGNSTQQL